MVEITKESLTFKKICLYKCLISGQLEITDVFNLDLLPPSMSHYEKLLPRFGHSLSTDSQGILWVFGGYSFAQGGSLNDIRAFDTKNVSWLPITVHFGGQVPEARFFHAWELIKAENVLYVHGGMNKTHYFDDLWKFDLLRKNWEKLVPQFSHYTSFSLAGT